MLRTYLARVEVIIIKEITPLISKKICCLQHDRFIKDFPKSQDHTHACQQSRGRTAQKVFKWVETLEEHYATISIKFVRSILNKSNVKRSRCKRASLRDGAIAHHALKVLYLYNFVRWGER